MTNLFETNQEDQFQIDPNKEYFPELVGEGKKFKDQEALAKKALYADEHIRNLEQENAAEKAEKVRLQAELNAAASLREMFEKMTSKKEDLESQEQPEVDKVQSPAIKPEDIEKMIAERIRQNDAEKIHLTNFNSVQAKLKERYGDNFATVLKDQTQELGLTPDIVNNLARTAPKAFFKTLGLDEDKTDLFQSPPRSNTTFTPSGKNKRTWAYWEGVRMSDPKTYNKPETQLQMMQDRSELGQAFMDGNWTPGRGR